MPVGSAEADSHHPHRTGETPAEVYANLGGRILLTQIKDARRGPDDGWRLDLGTLLGRGDIEVVCVCVPSGLHAQVGVLAAKAGKHLVVEKPIDVSLDAADRLIEAAQAAGVALTVISLGRERCSCRARQRGSRRIRSGCPGRGQSRRATGASAARKDSARPRRH